MKPESCLYTKDHEWIQKGAPKSAMVGITDHAQHELGDIVFVELPEVGTELKKGEPFGNVESVKAVSPLNMPVSGRVVEINGALEDSPELVNQSPLDQGWMIKVEVTAPAELDELMAADTYGAHVAAQK